MSQTITFASEDSKIILPAFLSGKCNKIYLKAPVAQLEVIDPSLNDGFTTQIPDTTDGLNFIIMNQSFVFPKLKHFYSFMDYPNYLLFLPHKVCLIENVKTVELNKDTQFTVNQDTVTFLNIVPKNYISLYGWNYAGYFEIDPGTQNVLWKFSNLTTEQQVLEWLEHFEDTNLPWFCFDVEETITDVSLSFSEMLGFLFKPFYLNSQTTMCELNNTLKDNFEFTSELVFHSYFSTPHLNRNYFYINNNDENILSLNSKDYTVTQEQDSIILNINDIIEEVQDGN